MRTPHLNPESCMYLALAGCVLCPILVLRGYSIPIFSFWKETYSSPPSPPIVLEGIQYHGTPAVTKLNHVQVKCNGRISKFRFIEYDVPQGEIFAWSSPFLLDINDLHNCSALLSYVCFQ